MSAAAQIRPDEHYEAELFESGGRQAVRLPDGIHIEGTTVKVRRIDGGILIEPKPHGCEQGKAEERLPLAQPVQSLSARSKPTREELRAFWARLDSYGADPLFPDGRNQGVFEVRELFK